MVVRLANLALDRPHIGATRNIQIRIRPESLPVLYRP